MLGLKWPTVEYVGYKKKSKPSNIFFSFSPFQGEVQRTQTIFSVQQGAIYIDANPSFDKEKDYEKSFIGLNNFLTLIILCTLLDYVYTRVMLSWIQCFLSFVGMWLWKVIDLWSVEKIVFQCIFFIKQDPIISKNIRKM